MAPTQHTMHPAPSLGRRVDAEAPGCGGEARLVEPEAAAAGDVADLRTGSVQRPCVRRTARQCITTGARHLRQQGLVEDWEPLWARALYTSAGQVLVEPPK